MDDLMAWLSAQFDEDAARAWAVHDVSKCDALLYEDLPADAPLPATEDCECGYPARVLREVEAKRKIIADCAPRVGDGINFTFSEQGLAEDVLTYLAAVHSDRPGFRPEWSPPSA